MARPKKPEGQRREPRSVSLEPRDWALLEGLAAEVGDRDETSRGTTSDAIRHLLRRFFEEEPWRIIYARAEGAPSYAEFQTGTTADGQVVLSRVDLSTGLAQTVVRSGPFFPSSKATRRRRNR